MSLPIMIIVIISGLLFLFFLILSIINFINVIRYGFMKGPIIFITFIYVIFFTGVVLSTLALVKHVDWGQTVQINTPTITLPK